MTQIDIQQMEANPGAYLEQVAKGETIVICKDQRPIAEIRPVEEHRRGPRPLGLAAGEIEILPEFYEPLPDDVIESFYNGDLGKDLGTSNKEA
jgi:antitoxin (DNA-binding transcriptional repressor) of toxin-antitoxin stability system